MTFYFYDLETTSINPRTGRIMQFAGQRTDENLNPIGEPLVCLVKLSEEILPDPEAVLVHGVSPQKAAAEGYTEAEFLKIFTDHALQPNTIIMGFNTIRFDDEFMRHTLWRNFYDPYEWQWKDGRSRWDMIDVLRMTRALRPDGIEWPVDAYGKPTNRLELMTKANNISHDNAHDALSDVLATIEIAKLVKVKQPKIFDFLLNNRGKKEVAQLLDLKDPKPVVHSSGRLSSDWQKTSVMLPIGLDPKNNGVVLVYDLRFDPNEYKDLSVKELADLAFKPADKDKKDQKRLPVKGIYLNKSPALAPLGVLDEPAQERIKLDVKTVQDNLAKLMAIPELIEKIMEVWSGQSGFAKINDVDQQLYDGFIDDSDKNLMQQVRNRPKKDLVGYAPKFKDQRLAELLVRYKARNFPDTLDENERQIWQTYLSQRLAGEIKDALGLEAYAARLAAATKRWDLDDQQKFLMTELQLYGESLINY